MPDPRPPIVRFAPSPNGLLHLGHARSALLNHDFARAHGGTFLLRIEDIDSTRCRPEFEAAIEQDMRWLGINWPEPVRRQSEHFHSYTTAMRELDHLGLVYPSFLSRAEIAARVDEARASGIDWPVDPDGTPHYPGNERDLDHAARLEGIAAGKPLSWRLDMKRAIAGIDEPVCWREFAHTDGSGWTETSDPGQWGDIVLARRDTPTSYHLSVTVDDHIQHISDIIRGEDLFAATSVHRLLQILLGYDAPNYRHHTLVTDETGRKLSKSSEDTALAAMRARGVSPDEIRQLAGLT